MYYPLRFIRKFKKIGKLLLERLEKKTEKKVVFIASRKIVRKPKNVYAQQAVKRSATMSAVHDEIMNDLVFPADVVGRRWRYNPDGSKRMKVFLDDKMRGWANAQRREAFRRIYATLTGKQVDFGFMKDAALQQVVNH